MTAARSVARINVISEVDDREINRVRDKLMPHLYKQADGREAVKQLLEDLAAQNDAAHGERWLDLIGHSVEHCFLRIGDWIVDGTAPRYFEHQLRDTLEQLRVKRIRLLGCSTATTPQSWRVIREIETSLGGQIEVFGTRRLLDDNDYDSVGFVGVDALAGSRTNTTLRPPPAQDAPRSLAMGCVGHTCFAGRRHRPV